MELLVWRHSMDELETYFENNFTKILSQIKDRNEENILLTILKCMNEDGINIENIDINKFKSWYKNVFELNYIQILLSAGVQEIIYFNNDTCLIVCNKGREKINYNLSNKTFNLSLEVLMYLQNVSFSSQESFASFEFKLKNILTRMTVLHRKSSKSLRHSLNVRILGINNFEIRNFIPRDFEDFFIEIMKLKKNAIICGSTASGKTTFLNTLLPFVSENQHTIIIEDIKEIVFQNPMHSRLLTSSNQSMLDNCKYALRMSPDRMIIGEIRSSEVVPLLLNLNSGHRGLLTTIHANSAPDAIERINLLFSLYGNTKNISNQLITNLICRNIDYVIHLEDKKINEIIEIKGSDKEEPIFEYLYRSNRLKKCNSQDHLQLLA
jgi:type IV secretion system protein VirB11